MTIRLSYQSPMRVAPAHRPGRWAAVPRTNGTGSALPATRFAANGPAALSRSERSKRSSTRRWAETSGSAVVETLVTLIVSVALTVFAAFSTVDAAAGKARTARDLAVQSSCVTLQDPRVSALSNSGGG